MADTEALKHFEHLSDIKLHDASYSSIDILIGSNVPDCFVVREQRIGTSGEPYAQLFPLGWAVIGPLKNSSINTEVSSVNLISDVSDCLMNPDEPTVLKCASTIMPESADFNNLMSVNSTGSEILPSDDSVLKIDVFGTADDFFVDGRLTRCGTWAMLKMVILSVLFFFF